MGPIYIYIVPKFIGYGSMFNPWLVFIYLPWVHVKEIGMVLFQDCLNT